jgi:hypothetical protein
MSKESKRVKIGGIEGTPIDMSNWYENRKKQELAEQEKKQKEKELEQERIDKITCPVCKSNDKIHHVKTKNNGIMGPGFSSWVTDEYLICKSCGVHYTDITKIK